MQAATVTGEKGIVVAGISARALAESARQAGWRVTALDLFGDADTREASARWMSLGKPQTLAIDAQRLQRALADAAEPDTIGWVAGAGFEAVPQLLTTAPPGLPLLGMSAERVAALRDPTHFFGTLERLGMPHPETRFESPADPSDWLYKRSSGSGGWHIQPAQDVPLAGADGYYQRVQAGTPMSALFLANGHEARLVALNRLLVRPLGGRPCIYRGAIGPIDQPELQRRVEQMLTALVPAFGLRGLASLDFITAQREAWLLEINPRPSASMVLHREAWPRGLLHAHVEAVHGRLPGPPHHAPGLRGCEILFAHRACRVDEVMAQRMASLRGCHDLPHAGACFAAGDPICSVSAQAPDVMTVEKMLAYRLARLAAQLHEPEGASP